MPAPADDFTTGISVQIADNDFALLKNKLAPGLPAGRPGQGAPSLSQIQPSGTAGGDPDNKIIGIATAEDKLDVASEEATGDFQKLGGSEALDEPCPTVALVLLP